MTGGKPDCPAAVSKSQAWRGKPPCQSTNHYKHFGPLVWYELYDTMERGIAGEKAIKGWKRAWKIELIEKSNPQWRDLYETLM